MPETQIGVPNYRILINGTELGQEVRNAVDGVTVEDELNVPTMFTIRLNTVNFENGSWRGLDFTSFKPGQEIKIFMGLDQTSEMVIGEITALDLTFGNSSYMDIRGFDRLHKLRFGTKRRSFKDMKDSDVVSSIANEVGLTPQTEATKTTYSYLFQNNQSNYEFLLERSKRIGYELLTNNKTLIFRASKESEAPELSLQYDIDFEKLSLRLISPTAGSTVEARGWDIKTKEVIAYKASSGSESSLMGGQESGFQISKSAFGDSSLAVLDGKVKDGSDAEEVAKAGYNHLLREFISGEGTCPGDPRIRAGRVIELKGLGNRFSGPYYVYSSIHAIKEEGYLTTFKIRRTGL